MLRHPPKFTYCGLTIILSNPSRFDNRELLSGNGGYKFNNECLYPQTNRYCCDIRLIDDDSLLLKGTRCILLLGQRAFTLYTGAVTTLNEQRGSPLFVNGIPCIASFTPQDAVDVQNWERDHNALSSFDLDGAISEFHAGHDKEYDAKGHGKTARSNYLFWLKCDTKKALRYLDCKEGTFPQAPFKPTYHIAPSSEELLHELKSIQEDEDFFFDIETDFETRDMRCFAFSHSKRVEHIYCVPILDYNYKPFYHNLSSIIRALSLCFSRCHIVAHNGANFDYLVLASSYGIPIRKIPFDTLIAQARIFPECEKSLGHCVSYWTYEPYHKNEGVHGYRNMADCRKLWEYCAKDVFTMALVKQAQLEYARKIPGLLDSIMQAMESVIPYVTMSMLGIAYDPKKVEEWIAYNDRMCKQYFRILGILIGPNVPPLISNKSCNHYFRDLLGYPPMSVSEKTGKASFDEEVLLKLRMKYENPVINFLLLFRKLAKETSVLKFKPWMGGENATTI